MELQPYYRRTRSNWEKVPTRQRGGPGSVRTPRTGEAIPLPLWFLLTACELRENDTTQTNRDFVRVLALMCNLQASSLAWLVLFSLMVESFPEFLQIEQAIWVGRLSVSNIRYFQRC